MAAGALFLGPDGRVLLVRPTYKAHWDLPGGYVEPGESPLEACRRELMEELGVALGPSRCLVVDWAPADGEGDKLLFVFDGGDLTDPVEVDGDEVDAVAWVSPDHLDAKVPPRLSRRIVTAIEARQHGRCAYAEHGTRQA